MRHSKSIVGFCWQSTLTFKLYVEFFMWVDGMQVLCSMVNFLTEMDKHNMFIPSKKTEPFADPGRYVAGHAGCPPVRG